MVIRPKIYSSNVEMMITTLVNCHLFVCECLYLIINAVKGVIVMKTIDYYKQQAKLLLKDYNLSKEHNFNQSEVVYDEPQEHFDINNVFSKANKQKGEDIKLMNAQHILAKIADFKDWNDVLHSSEPQREIGAFKLNAYKIGMDPHMIEAANMLVDQELFVDFVDDEGNVDYTDEQELEMWKYVLKRMLS